MSSEYREPRLLDEALAIKREFGGDAMFMAGGISVHLLRTLGLIDPRVIVGLRKVGELKGIRVDDEKIWIGAATTHREVEKHPAIGALMPALVHAFATIGTIRIRNQGTIGGNLAHADPAHDPPPALIAFGASAHIAATSGDREIPIEALFSDYYATTLGEDELLTGVSIPVVNGDAAATYWKFLPRTADDYATVSVGVWLRQGSDTTITDARVALGAVGATPIRSCAVERALVGVAPTASSIRDAAACVNEDISPLDDVRGSARYKRDMAVVGVSQSITDLVGVHAP